MEPDHVLISSSRRQHEGQPTEPVFFFFVVVVVKREMAERFFPELKVSLKEPWLTLARLMRDCVLTRNKKGENR